MLKITLEDLFHSPGQIGVLRVLFRSGTPLTGRQVQRLSGLANLSTMRALKRLAGLGVVSCRRAGRAYQYELRRSHWAVEDLIAPLFANEGKGLDLAVEVLAAGLRGRCLAAYLYGSALSRRAEPAGDLDLFLVVKSEVNRTSLEKDTLPALADVVSRRFGLVLEPNLVSRVDLSRPRTLRLAREIAGTGRKLCGQDLEDLMSG